DFNAVAILVGHISSYTVLGPQACIFVLQIEDNANAGKVNTVINQGNDAFKAVNIVVAIPSSSSRGAVWLNQVACLVQSYGLDGLAYLGGRCRDAIHPTIFC